ncbi:hypothetical protein BCR33DRAFT_768661 [Rhizoclosmatium globosum]|uniref:Uncharacterized protein n=1 Tax=Rhizoclosmatium globosum TaxID=329046 RepID=A0A1Y2BX20_9FUNG|nr:hypothetical protein BCR33DRAFT_768661 [Rhizoclosmatium globosum]|eukprot:ORY39296.1 hypothetical protein BCR33DRAFT_768661 [Rhizoclosmatium globosum]
MNDWSSEVDEPVPGGLVPPGSPRAIEQAAFTLKVTVAAARSASLKRSRLEEQNDSMEKKLIRIEAQNDHIIDQNDLASTIAVAALNYQLQTGRALRNFNETLKLAVASMPKPSLLSYNELCKSTSIATDMYAVARTNLFMTLPEAEDWIEEWLRGQVPVLFDMAIVAKVREVKQHASKILEMTGNAKEAINKRVKAKIAKLHDIPDSAQRNEFTTNPHVVAAKAHYLPNNISVVLIAKSSNFKTLVADCSHCPGQKTVTLNEHEASFVYAAMQCYFSAHSLSDSRPIKRYMEEYKNRPRGQGATALGSTTFPGNYFET